MSIERSINKSTMVKISDYDGYARLGEVVIDITNQATPTMYVGNVTGNVIPVGGGGGGNVAYANAAGVANTANSVAGGNVVGPVASANTASVANSVALANVVGIGNIASINITGNVSNVLRGDGTWGPGYGDSDVVTLLGAFGSNNIVTTGNVNANTQGYAIGYRDIPQIIAANTTFVLGDAGKHYYTQATGNITLTIPTSATVPFEVGAAITIVVQSTGNILVNAASGVTLFMASNSTAANRVVGSYGMATVMKVNTDTWFISGVGVA